MKPSERFLKLIRNKFPHISQKTYEGYYNAINDNIVCRTSESLILHILCQCLDEQYEEINDRLKKIEEALK